MAKISKSRLPLSEIEKQLSNGEDFSPICKNLDVKENDILYTIRTGDADFISVYPYMVQYHEQLKKKIVDLHINCGMSIRRLSKDYGIWCKTLISYFKEYGAPYRVGKTAKSLEIEKRLAAGVPILEACAELGLKIGRVRRLAEKSSATLRPKIPNLIQSLKEFQALIVDQYVNGGLKLRELSNLHKIDHKTISRYLREFGIAVTAGARVKLSPKEKAEMLQLYQSSPISIKELGEIYHLTTRTIAAYISNAGICRKSVVIPNGKELCLTRAYNHCGARRHEKGFSLCEKEYLSLVQGDCFYCGKPPCKVFSGRYGILLNGVDRIDNDVGYHPGNVVTSCWVCNRAKGTLTLSEFLEHLERLQKYNPILMGNVTIFMADTVSMKKASSYPKS